jgi:hypothetical protein
MPSASTARQWGAAAAKRRRPTPGPRRPAISDAWPDPADSSVEHAAVAKEPGATDPSWSLSFNAYLAMVNVDAEVVESIVEKVAAKVTAQT